MYRIVASLHHAPETNITLYVNHTSIKNNKNDKISLFRFLVLEMKT